MADLFTAERPAPARPATLSAVDLALIAVATRIAVTRAPSWAELESARADMADLLPRVSVWHPRLGHLPEACAAFVDLDFSDPQTMFSSRWTRVEFDLSTALAAVWRARTAAAMEQLQREAAR